MSKGSNPRPFSVTQHEYDTRWDAIFHKHIPDKCEHCDKEDCPHAIDLTKQCVYTCDIQQSQEGKSKL